MMTGSTEDGAREFAASGRTTAGTGTGVPRATAKQRAARIRELRRQKAPADKTQELPIDEGYSKTFLRVTVAVAVFLFAITLAGVLGINSMFENSRQQVVSNFTVQVLPLPGTDASRKDLLAVVGFLEKYPDVEQVTVLSDAELRALLEPWLGNNVDVEMLPIPKLLDVKIRNAKNFDYKELTVRLSEVSPQASINDHNLWLSRLLRFINSLKMLAVTVLILVARLLRFCIRWGRPTNILPPTMSGRLPRCRRRPELSARFWRCRQFWLSGIWRRELRQAFSIRCLSG